MKWRLKSQYNTSIKQKLDSEIKIDKPLDTLTKTRRTKIQIHKFRDKSGYHNKYQWKS
jgi:hypothetical protein